MNDEKIISEELEKQIEQDYISQSGFACACEDMPYDHFRLFRLAEIEKEEKEKEEKNGK